MTITRLVLSITLLLAAAPAAHACPSDFDQFGSGGRAHQPDGLDGEGRDVVVAPGGAILVAAVIDGKPAILRYTSGGQFDASFGEDGIAGLHVPGEFHRLALLADGSILAAGTIQVRLRPGSDVFVPATALAHFDSTGQLDEDFGDDGFTLVRFGDQSWPNELLVRSDGKIVVVGQAYSAPGFWQATLYFFDADGELSAALGAARALPKLTSAVANSVTELANKAIMIAGTDVTGDGGSVFLVRVNGNGAIDTSFGKGGLKRLASPNVIDQARSISTDAQGRIYVAGNATPAEFPLRARLTVRRFLAGGARDNSYGANGKAQVRPGGPFRTRDLSVSDDGVATLPAFRTKKGSIVVRFENNGQPDRAFGHLGISGIIKESLEGLDVHTNGKIVAAGSHLGQPAVIRFEGGEWDGEEACVEDCGNGALERLEECDDGNVTNGDGCSAGCLDE